MEFYKTLTPANIVIAHATHKERPNAYWGADWSNYFYLNFLYEVTKFMSH